MNWLPGPTFGAARLYLPLNSSSLPSSFLAHFCCLFGSMETALAGEGAKRGREEDEAESEERAPKNPKEQGRGREKSNAKYCGHTLCSRTQRDGTLVRAPGKPDSDERRKFLAALRRGDWGVGAKDVRFCEQHTVMVDGQRLLLPFEDDPLISPALRGERDVPGVRMDVVQKYLADTPSAVHTPSRPPPRVRRMEDAPPSRRSKARQDLST